MTLWLMRAGRIGERERLALEHDIAIIGWDEMPDLSACDSRADLDVLLRATYPDHKAKTISSWHGQLWSVRSGIQAGDLVVLPLKCRATVALGTVTGDYAHRTDLPGGPFHTRPVRWVAEVPRRAFDMDILLSFGAFMTVCRIERNDAEQRVRALMATPGLPRPGGGAREGGAREGGAGDGAGGPCAHVPGGPAPIGTHLALRPGGCPLTCGAASAAMPAAVDVERQSHELIRDRIARTFKGHHLATLVAALLEVQGYRTRLSAPGPDGGVDVLAGSGPFGFGTPRLVVQVKSQDSKVDVRVLRELAGVMTRYDADHGLLVGWGGFNQAVRAETAADYFRIRLWDAGDVVAAVKELYAGLPHAIRAQIPLKQVWTLIPEDAAAA